ncbi:MAG: helix-turn-helix domain-containing protein [archaeon]|nr:helix-turn-helix domain-containing protein [archaeon]
MDISRLLTQKESGTLEFKESLRMKEEIGGAVCAFANASGGTILIGVADAGAIKGLDIGKKTTADLSEYIKKNTDPNIFPEIKVHEIGGREIISVAVKESHDKPVFFKGRAYKRVGDTSPKISSSEIRKLAKESGPKTYWDEQICERATLSDIDEEKLKCFAKEAKRQRGLDLPDALSVSETLMRLKLQKKGKPTNACVLLFAKKPEDFFFQSEAKCIRFKGTDVTGPMIDFKVMNEDLITQLKKIEDFIFDHIPMAAWIEDGKLERQEKWLYPPKAIREALANALAHRDYETTGKVQVRIFDDRMEIWNPGKLLEPLTFEDLKKTHKSIPRNPLIARCFFWIKYIEEVGTGTNKIVEWCREWELPEPDFRHITGDFVTVLKNTIITDEAIKTLNERQRAAVKYIREYGKITNRDYQALCIDVSRKTLSRDLQELMEQGMIKQIGEKKGIYYIFK